MPPRASLAGELRQRRPELCAMRWPRIRAEESRLKVSSKTRGGVRPPFTKFRGTFWQAYRNYRQVQWALLRQSYCVRGRPDRSGRLSLSSSMVPPECRGNRFVIDQLNFANSAARQRRPFSVARVDTGARVAWISMRNCHILCVRNCQEGQSGKYAGLRRTASGSYSLSCAAEAQAPAAG